MWKLKQIENIVLIILWLSSISSFSLALLANYNLMISDYCGLIGLSIVSIISIRTPEKTLMSLMILLVIGLFNLASFIYFINYVLSFGINDKFSISIQAYSLILLLLVLILEKKQIPQFINSLHKKKQNDEQELRSNKVNRFIVKFNKLSKSQLEFKLKEDIVPEAKEALLEILKRRQNQGIE